MTSSENAERFSANGAASEKSDVPPWQRVAKDGEVNAANAAPDQPATATDDVLYSSRSESDADAKSHGFFMGGSGAGTSTYERAGKGRESVGVGTKARPTPSALRRPGRGPRRANLQIKRFDPWSVLKLSLVLGVAMFFVWMVGVGVLYTVLDGMGVWDKLNGTISSLVSSEQAGSAPSEPLISAGRVFGVAAILGAIYIVLVSALTTISAFIYNVSADLAGGLEVTLSERE